MSLILKSIDYLCRIMLGIGIVWSWLFLGLRLHCHYLLLLYRCSYVCTSKLVSFSQTIFSFYKGKENIKEKSGLAMRDQLHQSMCVCLCVRMHASQYIGFVMCVCVRACVRACVCVTRPEGIMFQKVFIILIQISPKITLLCSILYFLCSSLSIFCFQYQ